MEEIRTIVNGHQLLKVGSGTSWHFYCESCNLDLHAGPYTGDDKVYEEFHHHFDTPPETAT
jgi:hypothetical protein